MKIYLTLLFLFLPFSIQAQVSGNMFYQNQVQRSALQQNQEKPVALIENGTVSLDISALMNVPADVYVAVFNIAQIGETARQADELLQLRYQGFLEGAEKVGLLKENIYLDMLSLVPIYELEVEKKLFSKNFVEVPKGFELQKNLHIRYSDSEVLDQLVTLCAQFEIYDLIKVDYFVEDTEAIYDSLRQACIAEAKKRAETYEQLGFELSSEYHVFAEKSTVYYPFERYEAYQAFTSNSLEAIQRKSGVSQTRKPETFYYDPVAYKNYDLVINPVILEPMVQFAHNLKVSYHIALPKVAEKDKPDKTYFLLKPDGTTVPIDIK